MHIAFYSDSILKAATLDFKKMGQRVFVFIIGGATRSEVCFCLLPITLLFYIFPLIDFCSVIVSPFSCEFVISSPQN